MVNKDLIRKIATYGVNFVARPIGNLIKAGTNLGNPYGALAYGFLDIFRNATPKVKENKYVRLIQAAGFGFYTAKTITDLLPMIRRNFEHLIDIPFDVFMAIELGKNTIEDYRGKSFKKDIFGVPQDIINIPSNFKEIPSSFKAK